MHSMCTWGVLRLALGKLMKRAAASLPRIYSFPTKSTTINMETVRVKRRLSVIY